ncbi:MAG: lysine--tRNA ligase [Candidatus Saccharimonadales bacterium]
MSDTSSQDWLDQTVARVAAQHPEGVLTVSSGHSPSGTYHVGTLREIMIANAITWALRRAGREAVHVDVVDDYDALRKIPAGVSDEWAQYLGQPLAVVPDPFECHKSYGAHYLSALDESLAELGVVPDVRKSGYEMYTAGEMSGQVEVVLNRLKDVRRILTEVGGRQLDDGWAPVQIIDENNNLRTRKFADWNSRTRMVSWRDKTGQTGETSIDGGQVKLDWRLDWPARWAELGVSVEPFGRDHATKGGSYDTGKALVVEIFDGQAPYGVPYEFVVKAGETKKMSKSAGNVLTPADAMEVMPPEILRYFVIQSRPSRTLTFDSGLGLYALIDEYTKARAGEVTGAMEYARAGSTEEVIAGVPFNHLVAVYQAARTDPEQVRDILARTGYDEVMDKQWPVVERELEFVKNWLEKYAPDKVKFTVQDELPEVELSASQTEFLQKLADVVEQEKDLNGQGMHDAVYASAEAAVVKPAQAFVALYRVILGQDWGPKAGWFLASLDQDFLLERLRAAS